MKAGDLVRKTAGLGKGATGIVVTGTSLEIYTGRGFCVSVLMPNGEVVVWMVERAEVISES